VFAASFIPAGTVIWEFAEGVDWRISPEEMVAFPQPFQSRLRRYTYLDDSGTYILCGDNAKYMNHEDAPNCDDHGLYTVAMRDIPLGEELTTDYRAFDTEFDASEFTGQSGAAPAPVMNGSKPLAAAGSRLQPG
jgi:SET domain-containing protein